MDQILPHICIGVDDKGQVQVSIENYELFDCIDDFLADECNIEYDYKTDTTNEQGEVFTMHFPKDLSLEQVKTHLLKLEPEYIERLYSLNN